MDSIILKNMTFYACHGVLEKEKLEKQPFIIDMKINTDLSIASQSDSVFDTIDYSEVYGIVKKIVEGNSYNLLEKLAVEIQKKVFATYETADVISILIKKPKAPIDGDFDYMGVEIVKKRSEV
jgi:dihydroneopterin aldolase